MEGPQHGRGSQETEGEEETGPQITSSLSLTSQHSDDVYVHGEIKMFRF